MATIEEFCGQKKKDLENFQSGLNFILNFYCCRYVLAGIVKAN
mgnify:FL=1